MASQREREGVMLDYSVFIKERIIAIEKALRDAAESGIGGFLEVHTSDPVMTTEGDHMVLRQKTEMRWHPMMPDRSSFGGVSTFYDLTNAAEILRVYVHRTDAK